MIDSDDRTFPAALAEAFEIEFDYADGDGVDFEPFDQFESAEETTDWIARIVQELLVQIAELNGAPK